MQLAAKIGAISALSAITLLFSGIPCVVCAEDVVYVFSGNGIEAIHGFVVEEVPGESLKILTNDGHELTFGANDVAHVTRDAASSDQSAAEREQSNRAWTVRDGRKRPVAFYGWVGYSAQALGHVNATIREDEELLQSLGAPVEFDTFGNTPDYGLGLSFQAPKNFRVGFEVGYQTSRITTGYLDQFGVFANTIDIRILDLSGTVETELPGIRGLFVGASAGVGIGDAEQDYHFEDFQTPANNEDSFSDWGGAKFVGGAYAGYSRGVSKTTDIFVRTGYRMRNLGNFRGSTDSNVGITGPTEPIDNDGDKVEFDFSGAYVRAGVTFTVGG